MWFGLLFWMSLFAIKCTFFFTSAALNEKYFPFIWFQSDAMILQFHLQISKQFPQFHQQLKSVFECACIYLLIHTNTTFVFLYSQRTICVIFIRCWFIYRVANLIRSADSDKIMLHNNNVNKWNWEVFQPQLIKH